MINNGAVIIRYGHSVVVDDTSSFSSNNNESPLPILAKRLVAELHRSETLLQSSSSSSSSSSPSSSSPIHIKTKYFEADLSCVIVDDNVIMNNNNDDNNNKSNKKNATNSSNNNNNLLTSEDFISTLRCARTPYGLVQIVDMAKCSSQSLMSDSECRVNTGGSAPLFNLCLVVASEGENVNNNNNNNNNDSASVISRLPQGQQHLFQKWREICVDRGVELVPWLLPSSSSSSSSSLSEPQPPPIGIEKRGLLQSAKELTGSARVLEVLNQSLWATSIDPMQLLKIKERQLNKAENAFEGIYRENLMMVISSSRFTCDFSKRLFDRVPGVAETNIIIPNEDQEDDDNNNNNNSNNFIFVGSGGDEQNFSVLFQNDKELNCYFTPLQMMVKREQQIQEEKEEETHQKQTKILKSSCSSGGDSFSNLGVTEVKKVLSIPTAKLICFHLLTSDLKNTLKITKNEALKQILFILKAVDRQTDSVFSNRIKLEDSLSCIVVIENNDEDNGDNNDEEKEQKNGDQEEYEGLCLDLMQVGCEVITVEKEKENDDVKRSLRHHYDTVEGTLDVDRIDEVLSCIPWKSIADSQQKTVEQIKKQSPIEKNVVVVVVVTTKMDSTTTNSKSKDSKKRLAQFLSKSFSNDEEDSMPSAHEKKTQWLKRRLVEQASTSSPSPSLNCYSNIVLSTKYYSATADVIVIEDSGDSSSSVIKDVVFWTDPRVVLVYNHQQHNSSSLVTDTQQSIDSLLRTNVACFTGEENKEEEKDEKKTDDGVKPPFFTGPETENIALVVLDDDDTDASHQKSNIINEKTREFCEENFIEVLVQHDDENLSLTARVYDSLSCVEWPRVQKNPSTTTATNNKDSSTTSDSNTLLRNIHDDVYAQEAAKIQKLAANNDETTSDDEVQNKKSSSSAIESSAALLLQQKKQKSSTTTAVFFTCAIPPKTHYFDKKLNKTVLRNKEHTITNDDDDENNDDTFFSGDDDGLDDDNDMSDLLQQMREVRDSKRLTREERQKQAEELSKQFAKRLHKDDDLADAIAQNMI